MEILLGAGFGLLIAGILFVLTGSQAADGLSSKQAFVTVGRIVVHIAVAIGFAVLLASIDSGLATVVVLVLAALGIGWAVIRALRGPSTGRAILVLAGTFGLSLLMMLIAGLFAGGDVQQAALAVPINTTSDPAGDCECEPGYDLLAVGTDPEGIVWVSVGGTIPSGATYWLWPASDPFTPIEIISDDGTWSVVVDSQSSLRAEDVVAGMATDALHLQLGPAIGAFAITSAQGDRAPDTGYVGSAVSDAAVERYQLGYADLGPGQRQLGRILMRAVMHTGSSTFAVGFSADPDIARTGTLTVTAEAVEFQIDATSNRGGHTDRFAVTGDEACLDDGAEPCLAVWMNPYRGIDDLLSDSASIEVVLLDSREVLGEEAVCVAITDVGSTGLHLGEFCALADGTIAFVDDRTLGIVIVLTER